MDFRTSLETVLTEVHRRQPKDIDMATVALIKAMEFHRSYKFWFNEATWLWTMTTGTFEYLATAAPHDADPDIRTIPFDIQQPEVIQIQVGQNFYEPMDQVSIDAIRSNIFFEGQRGYPDSFCWFKRSLFFYSIPQSDFPCRMDYVRDLNRPRFRYDGSNWIFEERNTLTGTWEPLQPTYTNSWLDEGSAMIESWAKWKLYHSMYKDTDAAVGAWAEYQVEKDQLEADKSRYEDGNTRTRESPL